MRRTPLEYGDNFPVPFGSWDPTVPWRFPKHEVRLKGPSLLGQILPWIMLGLGVTLGVLWMSWHLEAPIPVNEAGTKMLGNLPVEKTGQVVSPLPFAPMEPVGNVPKSRLPRVKSRLV